MMASLAISMHVSLFHMGSVVYSTSIQVSEDHSTPWFPVPSEDDTGSWYGDYHHGSATGLWTL